jgi:hypothetical protein
MPHAWLKWKSIMHSEPSISFSPTLGPNYTDAELLLRLCSRSLTDLPADIPINWNNLLEIAGRHRVRPLLYTNLKRVDVGDVPPEVMNTLRGYMQSNAGRMLHLAGELRRLLTEFENAEIPVIPFKGLVLAATVYGDLSLRDAGDLDLLVHRDDIVRAADLLVSLGHQPGYPTATPQETAYLSALGGDRREQYLRAHCEHHLVYPPSQLNVDLHWALSLREFAVELDLEGIWRRARPAWVAGREVLTFAPEDLLIVLCLNGAKDSWERIDRICDVAQVLRRFENIDWPQVFEHARRSGTARMLCAGLQLALDLMVAPLAPVARQYAAGDATASRIVSGIRSRLLASGSIVPLSATERTSFDLQMRERLRDRAHYCIAHLRPGVGDWAAVPLPDGLSFLHYLIRPFRLLGRYGLHRIRKPRV